jgi:predicted nucleic-acid-binding protein
VIGLDTNILVRYFAQDDAKQSALVNRVMASLSKNEPGFVSIVTLCELVWVLSDLYAVNKPALINILRTLLESDELQNERKPVVWAAFTIFADSTQDFSDTMIAELGKEAGCIHTLTFDKRAAQLPTFVLLR